MPEDSHTRDFFYNQNIWFSDCFKYNIFSHRQHHNKGDIMGTIEDAFDNLIIKNGEVEITRDQLAQMTSAPFIENNYQIYLRENAPLGSPPSRRNGERPLPYEITEYGDFALKEGTILTKIDPEMPADKFVQMIYTFQVRAIGP